MSVPSLKTIFQRLKDNLFPGRKRRRELLANLARQSGNLYAELADARQLIVFNSNAISEVGQQVCSQSQGTHELISKLTDSQSHSMENQSRLESQLQDLFQVTSTTNEQLLHFTNLMNKLDLLEAQQRFFVQQIERQQNDIAEMALANSSQNDSRDRQQTRIQELINEVVDIRQSIETQAKSLASVQTNLSSQQVASETIQTTIVEHCSRTLNQEFAKSEFGHTLAQLRAKLSAFEQRISVNENNLGSINEQVRVGNRIRRFQAMPAKGEVTPSSVLNSVLKSAASRQPACEQNPEKQVTSKFCSTSYDYYSKEVSQQPSTFIYLDVKSIPRSGLHYFQRTLQAIFENRSSFCEWYQEPGCCRKMPCALTCYSKNCSTEQSPHLRLIKSHDFDLSDPIFPPNQVLRRVILIRDPIYALTSFWSLKVLESNKQLLQQNGINAMKINYLHEQPVLQMAYDLIDRAGTTPSSDKVIKWLEQSKKYMLGFIEKWGRHASIEAIVGYQEINEFVIQLVGEYKTVLPKDIQDRFDRWSNHRQGSFSSRKSPFSSPSKRITEHLEHYANQFQQIAEEIMAEDKTGLFAKCQRNELSSSPADQRFVLPINRARNQSSAA